MGHLFQVSLNAFDIMYAINTTSKWNFTISLFSISPAWEVSILKASGSPDSVLFWQVCKSTASLKMSSREGKQYLTLIHPMLCYILTSLHKPSKTNPSHKKQQSVTPCITSSWSRSQLKHSKEPCRNTHAVQVLPCTTKRLSGEMMQQLRYWACLIW